MEDRNQCIDAVRNNQGGLQIASFELDDNRALPRKWLQVGDHLVDRSTEYFFKLFLQDVLSRSEQRLVHLPELGLSFLSLSEPLFRRNRSRSGTEVVTRNEREWGYLFRPSDEGVVRAVREEVTRKRTTPDTVLGVGYHRPVKAGWGCGVD